MVTKYSDTRLLSIKCQDLGYYRCTRKQARAIMESEQTSNWTHTTKSAWKRNGGKYIDGV